MILPLRSWPLILQKVHDTHQNPPKWVSWVKVRCKQISQKSMSLIQRWWKSTLHYLNLFYIRIVYSKAVAIGGILLWSYKSEPIVHIPKFLVPTPCHQNMVILDSNGQMVPKLSIPMIIHMVLGCLRFWPGQDPVPIVKHNTSNQSLQTRHVMFKQATTCTGTTLPHEPPVPTTRILPIYTNEANESLVMSKFDHCHENPKFWPLTPPVWHQDEHILGLLPTFSSKEPSNNHPGADWHVLSLRKSTNTWMKSNIPSMGPKTVQNRTQNSENFMKNQSHIPTKH